MDTVPYRTRALLFSLMFFLLSACGKDKIDGDQKVRYRYLNRDWVTSVSHNNPDVPEDFVDSQWYESETGDFTVTYTINDGSNSDSCSCSYSVEKAESGVNCGDDAVSNLSDSIVYGGECSQVSEADVNFGAQQITFGTTSLECFCSASSSVENR